MVPIEMMSFSRLKIWERKTNMASELPRKDDRTVLNDFVGLSGIGAEEGEGGATADEDEEVLLPVPGILGSLFHQRERCLSSQSFLKFLDRYLSDSES